MNSIHKTTCRICKSSDLVLFLSLGDQPPANEFLARDKISLGEKYPLDVYFCRSCSLVQLLDIVSAEKIFTHNYSYFSSTSAPLVRHFEEYAADISKRFLKSGDLVVDIGSNDGVLLQFFKGTHRVLGIEPSENVAQIARQKGVKTVSEFFTADSAAKIAEKYGKAAVICANNVFAHIDDIDGIVRGIKVLLKPDGVYVFEAHYLLDLIEKKEFDTIYHEHLCYYSLKPLMTLFERFDMEIFDVERQDVHGGSIRVCVRNKTGKSVGENVGNLLRLEEEAGLHSEQRFVGFQKEVEAIRTKLVDLVRGFTAAGKMVVGYGAPAKGNTLLNYCAFTRDDLAYITDTTPHKIGLLTPGSHIPVVSPDMLKTQTPDYVLLLAWNYKDFILEKEKGLRDRGTKFIIPIPRVEIV